MAHPPFDLVDLGQQELSGLRVGCGDARLVSLGAMALYIMSFLHFTKWTR